MHPLISGDLVREIDADRRRRAARKRRARRDRRAAGVTAGAWVAGLWVVMSESADQEATVLLTSRGVRLTGPGR